MSYLLYLFILLTLAYLIGISSNAKYQKIIIEKDKQIEQQERKIKELELRHIREMSKMVKRNRNI